MQLALTDFLKQAFWSWSWPALWSGSFLYFLFLYFVLGWLFEKTCIWLEKAGLAEKIEKAQPAAGQKQAERRHSMVSLIIFGFSVWPVVWLCRNGVYQPQPSTFGSIFIGLLLLNVWNEIHFFLVHRLMHIPFFMRHMHFIHHRSRVPTVWSVYSFHWLEAGLLSLVPTLLCLVFSPPLLAVALYPLNSVLLNFSGHCNYRLLMLASPEGLASRHVQHHRRSLGNYGFASGLPDKMILLLSRKSKSH